MIRDASGDHPAHIAVNSESSPRGGGGGGGGGGTASLMVGAHCQTIAPAFRRCLPLSPFLPPPIFEGHIPPPPKIKHFQYTIIIYESDPKFSKQLPI